MKDHYAILGLERGSDPELLEARYKELHELYSEQRFKSGEEGNEGARKLQELEEAWVVIKSDIESNKKAESFGGDYSRVDALIRAGKYNEAQDMLDSVTDRGGEWHYMQAIVFYKREWLTEAKTQLEMALQEDPGNSKYKSSLDKLKMTISGGAQPVSRPAPRADGGRYDNGNGGGQYGGDYNRPPQNQGQDMADCLSTCCCAYCLTDCLCSAMRCI